MISLIDVVDPDPHDIDMDEELKCLGDVCMKWYVVKCTLPADDVDEAYY